MLRLSNIPLREARVHDWEAVRLQIGTPKSLWYHDSRPPRSRVGDECQYAHPLAFTADDLKLLLEYFPTHQ
jgi:hypothetical protein